MGDNRTGIIYVMDNSDEALFIPFSEDEVAQAYWDAEGVGDLITRPEWTVIPDEVEVVK